MQPLTCDNPGNFHGAALNAGVGEQYLAQGTAAELSEPAAAATQGGSWNQRPGKDPSLTAANKLHLTRPRSSIQAQAQGPRFIPARAAPALPKHPHLEPAWTALAQAPGQRAGIKQPLSQFSRQTLR